MATPVHAARRPWPTVVAALLAGFALGALTMERGVLRQQQQKANPTLLAITRPLVTSSLPCEPALAVPAALTAAKYQQRQQPPHEQLPAAATASTAARKQPAGTPPPLPPLPKLLQRPWERKVLPDDAAARGISFPGKWDRLMLLLRLQGTSCIHPCAQL